MTATSREQLPPAEQNEQALRTYFEDRPGWTVTKLDSPKSPRSADFLICEAASCFLCEVKTIESARANIPYCPIDFYLERREKLRAQYEQWMQENPDRQLILRQEEWLFAYGDQEGFRAKYSQYRKRNTEKPFRDFACELRAHLAKSSVGNLPYDFRLDSDDLYVPNRDEKQVLFQWLESEIRAIHTGRPGWQWNVVRPLSGQAALYSAVYRIHKPRHEYATHECDVRAVYQLMLEGPLTEGPLRINIYSYGGLNLDRITSDVTTGLSQIKSVAQREGIPRIPRVIALAFTSRVYFDEWTEIESHLAWLLDENPELSAIVIFDKTLDGTPPPQELAFEAWYEFQRKTPTVLRFIVFRNPHLDAVEPLPDNAFADRWSVQFR